MKIFEKIAAAFADSNMFDLSHDVKMSLDMGRLYPIFTKEVLPGDKWNISTENMLRFAPLISPVMHKIKVKTEYFFVPYRIIWPEWEDFITEQTDIEAPTISNANNATPGTLADYMGVPQLDDGVNLQKISALPFAAYSMIWDQWYRSQDLQDERHVPLVAGNQPGNVNTAGSYRNIAYNKPFVRGWQRDYFTSCLPFAQKGNPVTLPLLNDDSVAVTLTPNNDSAPLLRDASTGALSDNDNVTTNSAGQLETTPTGTPGQPAKFDPNGTLEVLLNAEASTIATLRRAFKLQTWLELDARAGTRIREKIQAHFGVKTSDARLNIPEFLGSAEARMVISEVLSTAETENPTQGIQPLGQMGGHGISVSGSKSFSYKAKEHGIIIGLLSVIPETAYSQGLSPMWTRQTSLDYPWPMFANIGEQPVYGREIMAEGVDDDYMNNLVFGYLPRYSDWKYSSSRIAGDMRTTLKYWHLGRDFDPANPPFLNSDFIEARPSRRIFAVTDPDVHTIYAHIFHKVGVVRKLPKHVAPGL